MSRRPTAVALAYASALLLSSACERMLDDDGVPPPRIQRIEALSASFEMALATMAPRTMVAASILPRLPAGSAVMLVRPPARLLVSPGGTWWSNADGYVSPVELRAHVAQLADAPFDLVLHRELSAADATPSLRAVAGHPVRLLLDPGDAAASPLRRVPPGLETFDAAYREVAHLGAVANAALLTRALVARTEPCPDAQASVALWGARPDDPARLGRSLIRWLVQCDRDVDFDGIEHVLELAVLGQYPLPSSLELRIDDALLAHVRPHDTVESMLQRALRRE